MRPVKAKIFAIMLALIMALAFSACAANDNSSGNTDPPPQVETSEPEELSQIADAPAPKDPPQDTDTIPTAIIDDLVVHFLDVGQAESTLIQLPNGQAMLIDGGNAVDASAIIDYIGSKSITTIDYLIITHPHADHIGGLSSIIDSIDIGSVYMPRTSYNTQTFEKLLTSIQNKGLQADAAKADVNIISIPDLQIDILAPVLDSYSELNNYSTVVKITFGKASFLFMGDAEALSEGQITADVSADVLKVGHHGSNTSTSANFLKKVSPAHGIISVGSDNTYGHPTKEVLSRLSDTGVDVYRTDLQGTIVFTSDGNSITVNSEPAKYEAPVPAPVLTPPPKETPETESVMVWLSATGSKYHSINNCGRMNPDKATQVTLEEAKKNYKPCSKCNPPR